MPQTNTYTILSIGPIYETMKVADNTRAVWTVSFMFSYLMRETIRHLRTCSVGDDTFLVPHVNNAFQAYLDAPKPRIGLFHDRLILKEDYASLVNDAFNKSVEGLTQIIVNTFKESKKYTLIKVDAEESEVKAFFQNYFQSYVAQVCIDSGNPLLELSKYIDAIEHEPRLAPHEEKEFLFLFLRLTNLGLLQQEAFDMEAYDTTQERCFKSLPEISAWELVKDQADTWKKEHLCLKIADVDNLKERIKNPEDEAQEMIDILRKNPDFKPYHTYVAIVHGDGDAFGKHLEEIEDNEVQIKQFSDDIFNFMSQARDSIRKYGGYPVVGSGEDLLFFAPVIYGSQNIFTQIGKIDKIFDTIFKNPKLSMSYGINISYYKFPLQESIEKSEEALWEYAKKSKWANLNDLGTEQKAKNAIRINIQKHSGQSHALTLPKGTTLYCQCIKLMLQELSHKDNLHLPHALHHSLERVSKLIDTIPKENIEPLFENMFNEKVHQTKHKKALVSLQKILYLLKDTSHDEPIHQQHPHTQKPSEFIFSILSIIKLLRGDA